MTTRLLVCALALILVPAIASAQLAADLHQGARVRIVNSSGHSRTAMVAAYTSDSLTLLYQDSHGKLATIALADATRIDVSRGISSAEGAARGGMIGLAVGGLGGWASARITNGHNQLAESVGSIVGALGGIALGATIGAFTGMEHWESLQSAGEHK